MSLELIDLWHKKARPKPTDKDFSVQLGCHLEEVCEMLETVAFHHGTKPVAGYDMEVYVGLCGLADLLKRGKISAVVTGRRGLLDSLADQIVTAVGVGRCAGMDVPEAARRVDASNWSKFIDNEPVFDANGKIAKGPNYRKPDLTGLYEEQR